MIQIGNRPIDTMYVGGKLVQQVYKGSKKVYPDSGVIPKAIRDSMVLWYDLKKQGATNESMQANPVLVDHSGNGHDAACGNFAWSGMSGIGGYPEDFTTWISYSARGDYTVYHDRVVIKSFPTGNHTIIDIRKPSTGGSFRKIASMKIKVSGLEDGFILRYYYFSDEATRSYMTLQNGEATLPESVESGADINFVGFMCENNMDGNAALDIVIEQLPLYPNALVFDGVDDKATCPAFHLGKDWTLLFDVAWMDAVKASAGISKNPNFFVYNNRTGDELSCFINRSSNSIAVPNTIICINSQLGFIDRDYSIIEDIGEQTNTSGSESIIMFCYNGGNFTTIALRKFLLFNRALSIDEIKWVKTNLM